MKSIDRLNRLLAKIDGLESLPNNEEVMYLFDLFFFLPDLSKMSLDKVLR